MSDYTSDVKLDDVLNQYVSSTENPNHANLIKWIRLYPQFEKELIEFTVSWSVMKALPPIGAVNKDIEDRLTNKGMSIVQNLLYKKKQEMIKLNENQNEFKGLIQERQNRGLGLKDLARLSRLSIALYSKIEHNFILSKTLPNKVSEYIGRALGIRPELIVEQLQGAPWVDAGANRFSSDKPQPVSQTNFFDEVRNDRTIKEEDRQYWLAMESDQNKD